LAFSMLHSNSNSC